MNLLGQEPENSRNGAFLQGMLTGAPLGCSPLQRAPSLRDLGSICQNKAGLMETMADYSSSDTGGPSTAGRALSASARTEEQKNRRWCVDERAGPGYPVGVRKTGLGYPGAQRPALSVPLPPPHALPTPRNDSEVGEKASTTQGWKTKAWGGGGHL